MKIKQRVVVVGACGIDLIATAGNALIESDSTPGSVRQYAGGVGRNIAENLSKLGVKVDLLTMVGTDTFGSELLNTLSEQGIATNGVEKNNQFRTATYVALFDGAELKHAVSDMELFDQWRSLSDRQIRLCKEAQVLVLDANVPAILLREICQFTKADYVAADTVSVAKCHRLSGVLSRLSLLKVNWAEACALAGLEVDTATDTVMQALRGLGAKRVLLTRGKQGATLITSEGTFHAPAIAVDNLASTNGSGDAMLAAMVFAHLAGADARQQLQCGMLAAAETLTVRNACAPSLSVAMLNL